MLIKSRPLYKVRMRQDQAHTSADDSYGTITQQLSARKQFKGKRQYGIVFK